MDIKQTLLNFHETLKSNPEISDDELLNKFPEIGKDKLSAAFDYSATIDSGKYKSEDEFVDKFPEFFPVKKKEMVEDGGTLPEVVVTASKGSSSQSQSATPAATPVATPAATQTSASSSSPSVSQPSSATEVEPTTDTPPVKDGRQKASDIFKSELATRKEKAYTEAGDINPKGRAISEVNQLYNSMNTSPDYQTAINNLKTLRQEAFNVSAGDSDSRDLLITNLREDAKGLSQFLLKDKKAIDNWTAKGLNPAQGLALDYMEVFEPEKFKAYQERSTATTTSDAAGIGKQIVNLELENTGLNILKTGLGDNYEKIQAQIARSNKGELNAEEQAKLKSDYDNLNKWITYAKKLEEDQYTKYPEAISSEIARVIQDVDKPTTGQGTRAIFNFANSIAGSIEDGLNAAYAGVFLNDKEKINNDLEVLAKTDADDALTYTTQNQSLINRPFLTTVTDEVKAKLKEIEGSSVPDNEKYKQKFEALKQARRNGQIYSVVNPNKSKVNWTGEAMLNTVTSVAPQVIGAIALTGTTGGFGATTKVGQLTNLFAVTASQSFGQRYNQAIQEGSENPYADAAAGTLIDAGTELFGNDIAQIKKVLGKGNAGKILDRLSAADWKRLMANKTNAFKNFGKVVLEQGKDVATESFVEEGLAQSLDNIRQGKPIGEGMKETILSSAIGFLPLKILGLPFAFKNANMVDKLNLYSAGFNKISTIAGIENQLNAGEISREEADKRKNVVNQMNGIINSMPMFDAKGRPLSDEKKATYAFNQYIKQNSKDTEGLPTSTVASINETAQQADTENGAILDGSAEVIKTVDLPEVTVTGVRKKATDLPEVTVAAGKKLFTEPNPETKVIITNYKKAKGIEVPEGAPITKLDENKSKTIADAYDAMKHDPNNPEVKAAYNALATETIDQYKFMADAGYKFEIYEGEGEPYKNSTEMIDDLRNNKHLYILSTEKEFGGNKITDKQREENPLLADSGIKDVNGKPLLINDIFRGTHDSVAHGGRGVGFGPVGEENAWDEHMRMYSPLAQRALTTETRGQNSWVNFNKNMRNPDGSIKKKGDEGYLSPKDRPFAEQKIGLLPEEFSKIEDNYTNKSPKFTVTADAPVDLPNVTVSSPIHKKVIADVNQAAKTLASSGVKFKIYDNADSFASESGQDKSTQGVFVDEDGTVSINLAAVKNSKDWNIAWHESSHPVMNIIRNTDRNLYDSMAKGLADLAKSNTAAKAIVNWSENNYEGKETQVDEAMVESIALMADGTIDFDSVPTGFKQTVIDFVNDIAKYLGLDPLLNDTDKATFIKKAKEISNALKTGTDISEVVGKDNVKEFKNNIGENVGAPTQLRVVEPKAEPVQFKESYPLSFVKPEDKIDIKSLIDEIQAKGQKVWFWVADQLGRGNYYDSVIDGEHYLDAGPSFALDPKNRKENIIWATGKGEKFVNDNIKKSDYLFIISGSPSKSKLFNKSVADITVQRLKGIFKDDYSKFKEKLNSISKISGLNKIVNDFNSFEELLESPKRKDFLIALDDQKEKKGTELKKFLDDNKLFVDYESLRDGFYKDNNFDMNDIMLVLKPTGFGGVSDHSTYQNNVLGTVIGVPDKKINAYDIMTPEFRAKYPELKSKTQQSQTVAPYGSGIKGVASPAQQKVGKVELPTATQKQMTEDDKGNYLFYHYSDKNIKTIDPNKFGSNTRATGRDERPGVGISMYYTRPDVKEQNVPGEFGYVVRVPKGKVYPFNQDPLNLIEPARRMFEKQYPGQAFDPNKQVAWVSKAAAGRGYPMTVAEWNIGRKKLLRAQTTEALKPEVYSKIKPGTLNQVETNPALAGFKPNAKKRGQAKVYGGVSVEDLKDFNSLPNVEYASKNKYLPLRNLGITTLNNENVKTIATKLGEVEGPFKSLFKAISKLPDADKVSMYDLEEMQNTFNSAGGYVGGLYTPATKKENPRIGIANTLGHNEYSSAAHEMLHWVTLDSVNKYSNTPEYKSLEKIFDYLKAKHPDIVGTKASGAYYGLQNFKEFMVELLTNKDFRDNMSTVMAESAKDFDRTSFLYKTKDNSTNADLITLLVDYVKRVIKDMMDSWGKKSDNIDFSKSLIDNATDLAIKAYFSDPTSSSQLSKGSANVDADARKSVANMLDKLSDDDIAQILMDEKGLTKEEAMEVIEDVKYDPSLNPSVEDIVGEVGEGERARELSKTFPDRGVDTIAKINDDAKKYFVVSNKQTAEEAQAFIDDKNPEDALDYLLTQPTDIPNRVRIWMSGAVMDKIDTAINEAQLKGDKETAQRLSDKQAQLVNQVAPLGTELGQAIQAFRRFYENSKGSPSMLQFYIKKITDQVESEKGKPLTDEERQNIVDLAKSVQSADEGVPKDEATYALGNYVSSITPVAATDIMEAIWYAHILSGITTQSTNFFANLWNSFAEGAVVGTREAIKNKSVMPFINGMQGFLSGIKQGANDAADILKTGVTKQDGDKFKQGNILEFFSWKQVAGEKAGRVLDWAGGYSPKILKYVGRALAATDAAFSRANSEAISRMMAYNIAQEEGKANPDLKINKRVDELLNKTAEKKVEAQEKAKAEGYLEGTTRYRRRVGEILEAGRSKEIRKEADEFGKRVTLNYEPEGFMRPVYKLALAMQQSTKLTRMFIPFTRIVVNLTENALNYTPLGFIKAGVGSTTTEGGRRKLTPDERADFAIKATIGLSTFVLLSGLTGEDEDDLFEITANGSGNKQKNYELMKSGWRPYSIKTKDGRYISYKDWPIAPILAAVGAMHDSDKYNSSDEPTNEATIAAQAMVISLYDKSVMKGIQDFVEIIDPKEEYNQSAKMFDRLKNWGADQTRTMAVSNFTQQAFKFASEAMDNPIKASKGVERIYRDIPYLNDGLNPILDVFGEPVKPSTSERLLPITLGKPSKDEILAAFNENGVYIGKPKTRPLYVSEDPSNEETRDMTDAEYYQFTKRSGQITKRIIMEEWSDIKEILAIPDKKTRKAELKAYTSKLIEDARKEAFYEFPNQE